MSRERELLRRLLENFEQPVAGRFGDLFDEVRELLSTPEPTQNEEPVAWFSQTSRTFSTVETSHHTAPLFLYPAPRPEFVRLSEEEIDRELIKNDYYSRSFTAGVRFAEKHHGIGGE